MRLVLVLPGIAALPAASLAGCVPFASLAAKAPEPVAAGIEAATLAALGVNAATGPVAALGAGADPGDGDFVLHADPVALVAGHDDVRLLGRIDDLDAEDAAALRAALDAHFAGDGLAFAVPRPDAWFARLARSPALATTPLAAARGRPLAPLLPGGDEGRTWRRWQNEIQMLLHAHPVNAAREARGQVPVTGIWFWGGGRPAEARAAAGAVVLASPGRQGDFARGLARLHGTTAKEPGADLTGALLAASREAGASGAGSIITVAPATRDEAALARLAGGWLAPSRAWCDARPGRSVTLVADAGAATPAFAWTSDARGALRRMLDLVARPRAALPPGEPA